MRFSIIASGAAAFVGLLFDTSFAVPVTSTNTVLTPGGHRANANLHQVSSGSRIAHVGSEIHVFDPNGTVMNVITPGPATRTSAAVTPEETGWVTYANWLNTGTPIGSFGTTWTVPPVPATWHGQTLFLFNSIEPSTFDAIMQPVLQYGGSAAGGGEFWAVATWYLYGDNTFFTTPIAVNPGQVLNGGIQLVGTYSYLAQFTNVIRKNLPGINIKFCAQISYDQPSSYVCPHSCRAALLYCVNEWHTTIQLDSHHASSALSPGVDAAALPVRPGVTHILVRACPVTIIRGGSASVIFGCLVS
ncbi:hypothetical protein B0H11DRAFT_2307187 [Mycena galericulata]|nr:hypothetical protein B0H11DRAFT_2307187 [Mycena galericulata]